MSFSRRAFAALTGAAGLALLPAPAGAIVGGTNAPAGKYPSVANVVISGIFGCTGTLVAPQWVLTAGHCSSLTGGEGVATPATYPPQAFSVTVAGIKADRSDGERVTVDRVTTPTDYLLTNGYDVSLLHLAAPARATPTPVAGQGYEALWKPGVLTEIVGFGVTREGGSAPPVLQQAQVPVVTDTACGQAYPNSFEASTQLCAGYPQGGTDTCQGDSGGPAFSRTAERLFVVASSSYGRGCARPNFPGVYARVADATLREGFVRKAAPDAVADMPPATTTSTPTEQPPAPVQPAAPAQTTAPTQGPTPTQTLPTSSSGGSTSPQSPTPVSTTTTTPNGTVIAAVITPTGFRAALTVSRALRRTARARGLRFGLGCSAACSASVRLQVDGATARRLGLSSRTVGTTTLRRTAAGRTTKRVIVSRRLVSKLKRAKGEAFTVVATITETRGGDTSVLTTRAVLRGR